MATSEDRSWQDELTHRETIQYKNILKFLITSQAFKIPFKKGVLKAD